MTKQPPISLLICTHNRADQLRRFLDNLPAADIRALNAQIVLVDNASSDATPQILDAFQQTADFAVEIFAESRAGKGGALNAGLRHCRGELIALTDDDCYLGEGYLRAAIALLRNSPVDYVGGKVLLFDPADSPYGCWDEPVEKLFPPKSVIKAGEFQGANMVIHRRVFDKIGPFDPALGPGTPFRFEDLDILARAAYAGFTGLYTPDLVIHHHHGRKPGLDITLLSAENDYGRGGFYAKCLTLGYWRYALHWALTSLRPSRIASLRREIVGALRYARWARHTRNTPHHGAWDR